MCVEIGLQCVEHERKMRPSIADIVEKLNAMQEWGMNTGTVNPFGQFLAQMLPTFDKPKAKMVCSYAQALLFWIELADQFYLCQGPGRLGLEALGFSVRSLNQVMEVPGFLPGYHSRGEIKNREREIRR